MASASGSIYLEAATPLELLNAFMDAEMMSITYTLSSPEDTKKGEPTAKGKIGVPITIPRRTVSIKDKHGAPFCRRS